MTRRHGAGSGARTKTAKAAASRSEFQGARAPQGSERDARSKRPPLAAGLYVVATPIGNAADIGLRALDVLAAADVVACEDSRVTGKLLAIHGRRARLASYHEHNAQRVRPKLLARLDAGQSVALVSDAGTPLVSDPGYKLVAEAAARGHEVRAVPGASAALAALVVSGLPSDRFLFAGFLPARPAARRRALAELAGIRATLVLLESPRRLAAALADMAETLGPRPAAVAREMTKRYEEVRRAGLVELARHYAQAGAPRGEVVVVVGPPRETEADADELDTRLRAALEGRSLRDAAAEVAAATGLSRRKVYARAIALARGRR